MPATITSSAGPALAPDVVTDYTAPGVGGTIVHPILGTSNTDITLRAGSKRRGRLGCAWASAVAETASLAAQTALLTAATFTLVVTETPSLNMTFVVAEGGTVDRTYDPRTDTWKVVADYVEVTP